MKEILITSSVLILSVIVLRLLFRSKVSRKLIYGAWLLVALRLLIPIQFGQLDFSILTQAEPVTEAITDMAQKPVSGPSREEVYADTLHDYINQGQPVFIPEVQEKLESEIIQSGRPAVDVYDEILEANKPESVILPEVNQQIETVVDETVSPTLGQIALGVWITGMVAMAAWFLGVNLAFRRNLRNATPSPEPGCKTPVKVSAAIASPCVFGLLRPVIYLTPNCAENERIRRHVLTHEQTHLRHGDHIWAWVRCVCLCVYWFNPLVWVAASLSKRDCELACDEAALKILGEDERLAYGKTLVDMVSSVPAPGQLLETATAMHETKKQLKERVKCIVKQPKVFLTAAIALLLVLTIVTGCTFSGAATRSATDPTDSTQLTTEHLPKELVLSTYDTGYDGTVINDEILMDLYAQAKTILLEYTEVILPDSDLFHLAQENYPNGVRKADGSIIIDTTNPDVIVQPKYAQHVIVLYFLCDFKCAYPINDATFPYFDRYLGNSFFLYSGPLDEGFSNLKAYCEAIWLKGHTGSKYSYFINADGLTIHRGSALGLDIFNEILNSTATPPTTEVTPPTTVPPTTDGNELDLDYFNALFRNNFVDGKRNGFYAATTFSYSSDYLNLKYYFELGYPEEPEVTKAELEELAKIAPIGLQNYVCKRLPKDKVAAELKAVFDISLSNLRKVDLRGLYYLESTDCYYCFQTRPLTNPGFVSALAAEQNDDGTVSVLYIDGLQTEGTEHQYKITLKKLKGGIYRVLSNARVSPEGPLPPAGPFPLADIPVITQTATLPANPTVEDLLLDPYTGSTLWYDPSDHEFDIDIELPLLVPFCDGAKAINEAIRNDFQWIIDNINHNYAGRYGEFEKTISYEAYLNGDVLSLIITRDGNLDHNAYHTYNLDISTGKQLSIYDMAQRFAGASYPEFLMHATYTAYDYLYHYYASKGSNPQSLLDDFEHDTITMQDYKLALDADGTLILYNGYNSTFMRTVVVPFDPTAHSAEFSGGEKDAYQWLFTRNTDGTFSTYLGSFLVNSFFLDPDAFLKYLSQQDDALIQEIAASTVSGVPEAGTDQFKTLCNQYLSNNATAKAAKALLDALDK